jgi:hypothetical protein
MDPRVELLQVLNDGPVSVAARPPWRAASYFRGGRLLTWLLEEDTPGAQLVAVGLFPGARVRVTPEDTLLGLWRSLGEIELGVPELDDAWAIEGEPREVARAVLRSATGLPFLTAHLEALHLAGGLLDVKLSQFDEHAVRCCHELVESLHDHAPGGYLARSRASEQRKKLREPPPLDPDPQRPILESVREALEGHDAWAEREGNTVRARIGLSGLAGERARAELLVLCFPDYPHAQSFELRLYPHDPPGLTIARSLEPEDDEAPVPLEKLRFALRALLRVWEGSLSR